MKEEVAAAALFISKLVEANTSLPGETVAKFERRLGELLEERFSNHWHPERPWQGQGYRCLRVNENTRGEPTIERAARDCGLTYGGLSLPVELTVWVDPEEVCCRFGEQKGSCCTVASFRGGNKENFIETFDFSRLERPASTPAPISKRADVLRERKMDSGNVPSPPSSTQSTPSKRKPFGPTSHHPHKNQPLSPTRSMSAGGVNTPARRPYTATYTHHQFHPPTSNHHQHPHHPPPQNGSYSPPFFSKAQSWVNLSQTPPPPPSTTTATPPAPHHMPLLTTATSFVYPPAAPPHYSHSQMPPPFTRSPPNMGPQRYKWNAAGGASYPRPNDRHQWFGHRALARV
ncbi:hypothetical protein Pcinc_008405 [Petrolisthes cinctipes]|uniref:Anti-proliferative protein domain-containing protein n=1 Tax=Petrolisthes cinctipes TaxID=88211 RepID=A0AAE1GD98_PETCI|nr:hypothetical protein Pcinc_008405 [Petrolisthes cinctipes]